jgi:polar amino acid transport system permease protein
LFLDLLENRTSRLTLLGLIAFAIALSFPWQVGYLLSFPPLLSRIIGAGIVAGLIVCNAIALGKLPFEFQVIAAWLELIVLFALFFWSFGLDYQFILARIPGLLGFGFGQGFMQGAILTVAICLVSIAIATILALLGALGRLSSSGLAFGLATFYISFFRGTPLLLQILLIYLGLPQLGLTLEAVPAGVIALALCYGAYMAEIFRAGIVAVGRGQREAALSLGLKPSQSMRLVILPQAMRLVVPPIGNQFIAMLKDSSLVSTMGVWELMYLARTYGRAEFKYMEMLITAAIIYWILSAVFEVIQARIERHYGKGVRP